MSTRASLIYRENPSLHIYQELTDDTVHVEVIVSGVLVDCEIMPYKEWVSLGLPQKAIHLKENTGKKSEIQDVLITCFKCGEYHSVFIPCPNDPNKTASNG